MTLTGKLVGSSIGSALRRPRSVSTLRALALDALTYDPTTFEILGVKTGIGGLTNGRASTRYVEDHEGIYRLIAATTPAWHGARYSGGVAYSDDGTGTLLSPLPMLDHNPAATNDQIKSNDLADAEWTSVNMTVGDQDVAGLTGAPLTACTLTASAGNGTVIASAITAASGNHATKWYLQRSVGTGVVELTVDGGSTWQAITASLDADFAPGIVVDQAAVTNPQIGIRIVTSGDAVIVGNAECHLDSSIAILRNAAPIITTTTAVTITADALSFDILNHFNSEVCYFFEWSPGYAQDEKSTVANIISLSTSPSIIYDHSAPGAISTYDSVSVSSKTGLTYLADDIIKLGVRASSSDNEKAVCVNGAWGSVGTYAGYLVSTPISLMKSFMPMRMRGFQRWEAAGSAAQESKIDELML